MESETMFILINIAVIGLIACIIVKLYYREEESGNKEISYKNNNGNSKFQDMISSTKNVVEQTKNKVSKKETEERSNPYDNVSPYFKEENDIDNNNLDDIYRSPVKSSEYESWEEPNDIIETETYAASKVFQEPIEEKHKAIMNQLQNQGVEFTELKTNEEDKGEDKVPLYEINNIEEKIKDPIEINPVEENTNDNPITEDVTKESTGKVDGEIQKESHTEDINTHSNEIGNTIQAAIANEAVTEDINIPLKDRVEENKKQKEETKISEDKKDSDEDLKELFSIDSLVEKAKEKDGIIEKSPEDKNLSSDESILNIDKEEKLEKSNDLKETTKEEDIKDHYQKIGDIVSENNYENDSIEGDNLLKETETKEKEDEFGQSLENTDMFEDNDFELVDFGEIKDSIKNSKIVKNVKKFTEDKLLELQNDEESPDDEFIRSVRTYDIDEEPIYVDNKVREENLGKMDNIHEETKEVEKPKPTLKKQANTITVKINNNDEVLKKGDTIIFNYNGESYSSKLFNIYGSDVEVKYRGKNVLINSSDIKKRF
ncbi:hypothetical protein [Methanobrevibacter sp. DSM 116169]|uniref:hypothetical protein n=1 Tax=Methanobrevibacter sp. DSM 116169 TaxID=3242727 RepID=UPI0038FC4240